MENKVQNLEAQLARQSVRDVQLQRKEEELNRELKATQVIKEEMQKVKSKYEAMIQDRSRAELQLTGWLKEITTAMHKEFDELTRKNVQLSSSNQVLLNQVTALKPVQDQLKSMVAEDQEIDVQGVFVSNADIEIMEIEMKNTGNLIWKSIRDRFHTVLMRPWEAFASEEHKELVTTLEEQIQMLKDQNVELQAKQVVEQSTKVQIKDVPTTVFHDSSLEALKAYQTQSDLISEDSTRSFHFQADIPESSTFKITNQMNVEVSSLNQESVQSADLLKTSEETHQFEPVDDFLVKDAEEDLIRKAKGKEPMIVD